MEQSKADAEKAMAEARAKLNVNYFDELGIQKEPYELQREALLSGGAQAIEAGRESGRGAVATAGRVQMAQNEAQAGVRTAMGEELSDLAKLSATEDSRLRDINVQLDLEEVAGAQQATADAQRAAAAATKAGFAGVQSTLSQAADMVPLFGQDLKAQQDSLSGVNLTPSETDKFNAGLTGPPNPNATAPDFSDVKSMTRSQYKDFMKSLSPQQRQVFLTNPQYLESISTYNPFRY